MSDNLRQCRWWSNSERQKEWGKACDRPMAHRAALILFSLNAINAVLAEDVATVGCHRSY